VLKLKRDEPVLNFAFNFNLRHYTLGKLLTSKGVKFMHTSARPGARSSGIPNAARPTASTLGRASRISHPTSPNTL